MKKILKVSAAFFALLTTTHLSAQDSWFNVADAGIDNYYNSTFNCAHVFKGNLYVGSADYAGNVYRSATGNPGSWSMVYNYYTSFTIEAMSSVSNGGGVMYISTGGGCCDSSKVLRSSDGVTWSDYYVSNILTSVSEIVPFKGAGTVDSVYLIENTANGGMVYKSAYDSNDPHNTGGSWQTVLDFPAILPGTSIFSATVHNGKMYIGTNMGATVYSSSNGNTWAQNMSVGNGFGDPDNQTITAMVSFGGYLYVAAENPTDGAQIWRSNDDVSWTLVQQLPAQYYSISSMSAGAGKLWVTAQGDGSIPGEILKSDDGLTYTVSNANGFGYAGNSGFYSSVTEFGNNVYWTGQNYGGIPKMSAAGDTRAIAQDGAQIWRLCTATPPAVSLGPDRIICAGTSTTLDAGPATSYLWSNGENSQTMTTSNPGIYSVTIVGANGCDAKDQIRISTKPSPILMPPNIPPTVCNGTSVPLSASATANAYIPEPPIHKTTNVAVPDSDTISDVIVVSGAPGTIAGNSLLSVTIDSLYHTYSGDLMLTIIAPDGSSSILSNSNGGSTADVYFGTEFSMYAYNSISGAPTPYTGEFLPADDFSNLTGSPDGNWKLLITDMAGGDVGTLKGWSIRFKTDDNTLTYLWTPSTGLSSTTTASTIATPSETTVYTITATNGMGCSTSGDVTVSVAAVGSNMPAVDTVCAGYTYFMDSGSPTTHWSPATGLSDTVGQYPYAIISAPITYYMTDTIAGCPVSDSIHLFNNPALNLTSPAPYTACYADFVGFTATASGGTPPYTFVWGSTPTTNDTLYQQVFTSMSYSLSVIDAAGCYAYGGASVTVSPSTDIYGTVTYSGGPVAFGNVVLYKYEPYLNHFDTVQTTTTDAAGNYHFAAVDHAQYLIEAYPPAALAGVVPTYYGNTFLWDAATIVMHDCVMNDTLDILSAETITLSGPGSISGYIYEDFGFGFDRVPGDPVPGIDVKLGRNPGGQMVAQTNSDPMGSPTPGQYRFTNLPVNTPGGYYTVYVDIPGLGRDSVYNVVIDGITNTYTDLNYFVDSTQIHPMMDLYTGMHAADKNGNVFSVFPNPSKETTTVRYSISSDATVSLGVYNVLGVKVAELVNTEQVAGTYSYSFNAKNKSLDAGVYFITLITDGKASIQRLVITE